jgi:hypothetical protein
MYNRNPWTDADVEAHWDAVAHRYITENERVKQTHDQRFLFSIPQLDLYCNARVLNISSRDCEAAVCIAGVEPSVEVTNAEISQKLIGVAPHSIRHLHRSRSALTHICHSATGSLIAS